MFWDTFYIQWLNLSVMVSKVVINLYIFMYLCNLHLYKEIEYFLHLRKFFPLPVSSPSQGSHCSEFFSCKLVLLLLELHKMGYIVCAFFCIWLFWPSMMFLSFIYVTAYVGSYCFFSLAALCNTNGQKVALIVSQRHRSEWWAWAPWHSDLESIQNLL